MQQITPNLTSLSGHRHFVISCESPIRPHKRSTNRRWQKAKQYVPKTFTKFHHENEFLPLWANKPYYLRLRRLKMRRLRCEGLMDQLWRDLSNTSSDSLSNNYLSEPRDYSLSQQQQLQLDHQHQQQIQELRRCQYQEYLQIQQQQQLQLEQYKQESRSSYRVLSDPNTERKYSGSECDRCRRHFHWSSLFIRIKE